IGDIKPNLRVDDLPQRIARVIDTLTPHESELQDQDGHWDALRLRPYVTLDNKIDGASVVLLDIHTINQALEQLERQSSAAASSRRSSGIRSQGSGARGQLAATADTDPGEQNRP